jgi:electron transfer flavoprotein alpha/beta subunit
MRIAVCLHGASVARSALRLHPTDRRAIQLGRQVGADVLVIEAVGERGCGPQAVSEALGAGASRAVRIVDSALLIADAQATGIAFAATLTHMNVDLVLFGTDADPQAIHDVPACIAHHMSALYLTDVRHLTAIAATESQLGAITATARGVGWNWTLEFPLNTVLGIAASAANLDEDASAAPAKSQTLVDVVTLFDLKLDPALIRRRDDRRGVTEPAPRPLVTLTSALAVGALLGRGSGHG